MSEELRTFAPFIVVCVSLLSLGFWAKWSSGKARAKLCKLIAECPYEVIAEGIFEKADRCKKITKHEERTGTIVHTTRRWTTTEHWTAVYLEDGRSWVFDGHVDAPFLKGTNIRIMERKADGDVYLKEANK